MAASSAAGRIVTGLLLMGTLAASPAWASDGQRQRERSDRRDQQREERAEAQRQRGRDFAVARSAEIDRQNTERQRQIEVQRPAEVQRRAEIQRQNDWRNHAVPRVYTRPNYVYRGYGPRTVIVPRIVRPRIVTVVPYQPFVYRPRLSLGAFYGAGGAYPYGYTPRGYFDPIPGRLYGGLRITDAPREAQVFADGYFVGIVDDFDGVFQHLNLEAGPHHIEIRLPGAYDDGSVAFDVAVQPGRTITYRADWY
jgi:hypothetical protein